MAVKNPSDEVVFDQTYELPSGEAATESDILGWKQYTVELVIDGTESAMAANTFPVPNCWSPKYYISIEGDYYANFSIDCP